MERITRRVQDLGRDERSAVEQLVGRTLRDEQEVCIEVVTPGEPATLDGGPTLPDWCNVYDGLSPEEVSALECVILSRANLTRPEN